MGLATVCAVVHNALTGQIPDPRQPNEMDSMLNDVARALSIVVPIFAPAPDSGGPTRLSPFYLSEGTFSRGAQVFTSKSGNELRGLTVQRRDMHSAITILKSSEITFRRHF